MVPIHAVSPLFAFVIPPVGSGTDWLAVFSANLDTLTTQNGGALSQLGTLLLAFVSLMMLVQMVVGWNTSSMSLNFHRQPVRAGDLTQFLLRLIVCALLETYWVTPIPGASFGINHLFSYCAAQIVQALDQNSLNNLQTLLRQAGDGTPAPSILQVSEIICYYLVICIIGAASGILFLINISGFILYAVCALFGPIFIPLYMTNMFRGKFLHYIEVLLSLAMVRAVAAGFIFVWAGFMTTFIQKTFNGDYSIQMWLANLIPVLMIFICFMVNMLAIPSITQMIFGGGAGLVGKAERAVMQAVASS